MNKKNITTSKSGTCILMKALDHSSLQCGAVKKGFFLQSFLVSRLFKMVNFSFVCDKDVLSHRFFFVT